MKKSSGREKIERQDKSFKILKLEKPIQFFLTLLLK